MTGAVLLDTHIALWLENGDERLRPFTLAGIERCWRDNGTVLISAVSVWEIGQLIHRGRIEMLRPFDDCLDRLASRHGIEIVSLDFRAAARAYRLDGMEHGDPADRLLVATAIERACPMVTYDGRIARFAQVHGAAVGFEAWD